MGAEAAAHKAHLEVSYPVSNGIVQVRVGWGGGSAGGLGLLAKHLPGSLRAKCTTELP